MITAPTSKFRAGEVLALSDKPMRVAGLAQYDAGDGKTITRYLLADAAGATLILQEEGGVFALLRPFPPAAPPVAEGSTVSVMGEKYALAGVRKLKTVATSGDPSAGLPKAPLVLSGRFDGKMGTLLRELVPGAPAQTYFFVKPVAKDDLLTEEELTKRIEAERIAAEVQAQSDESDASASSQKPWAKAAGWIVMILVVVALVYACSDDDDSSSSHGIRVGTGSHSHGGK